MGHHRHRFTRKHAAAAMAVMAVTLALALAQALSLAGSTTAEAKSSTAPSTVTVGSLALYGTDINGGGLAHYFSSTDGDVLYCADAADDTPYTGEVMTRGSAAGLTLDYVLYYGYGGQGYEAGEGYLASLSGYSALQLRYITQQVIWYVVDGITPGDDTASVALAFYEYAVANADSSATYAGTSYFYTSSDSGTQRVILQAVEVPGHAYVQKSSSDSSLVSGNAMYSLEGAVYGVYSDSSCTTQVATLTTDSTGATGTVELDAGTYYVKEVEAPTGYKLDSTVYEFTVTSNETTEVAVTDVPLADTTFLCIHKVDSATGGTAQGEALLAGALYEVSYYDTTSGSTSGDPLRTWVFQTDEDGLICLDDASYLAEASSDELYSYDGTICYPLGTYRIREVQAPKGYETSSATYVVTISADEAQTGTTLGGDVSIVDGQAVIVDGEDVVRGGVGVWKRDDTTDDGSAQGDATLAGAIFTVYNATGADVYVDASASDDLCDTYHTTATADGTTYYVYADGAAVCTITSDETGHASTSSDLLPYGTYEVVETTPPEGYTLNSDWDVRVMVSLGETVTDAELDCEDAVARIGLEGLKVDADRDDTVAQGDATLAGAVIAVTYSSEDGAAIEVGGVWYASGSVVMTLVTDEDGSFGCGAQLPYGTYTLTEVSPSTGYLLNSEWSYTLSASADEAEDGTIYDVTGSEANLEEEVIRGGVSVQKLDDGTLDATAQGDATLAGAVVTVTNVSEDSVVMYADVSYGTNVSIVTEGKTARTDENGKTYYVYEPGDDVLTMTTDEDGFATTSADALPYGTYTLTEVTPSEGYLLNTEWSATIEVRTDGTIYDAGSYSSTGDLEEEVIRGGVTLRKVDAESGLSSAQGKATLAGAEIEVENASDAAIVMYVTYDGEEVDYGELVTLETAGKTLHTNEAGDTYYVYEPGEVVLTLVTDEDGVAGCGAVLPYGTYVATEAAAPTGYTLNSDWSATFEVREDGAIVDLTGDEGSTDNEDVVADQVIRGDLALSKKVSGTSERLAYAVFALTSNTTGETHILVCDENGMLSTASDWNSHESDTNANDDAVTWYEDGTYEVDEDALDAYAGVWFTGYADGDETGTYVEADDDLGALPYDTYTLTELRTSANEGTALVTVTVTITRNGREVDYGTLYDDTISFSTELTYEGVHVAPAASSVILVDSIVTEGIDTGETYELRGRVDAYDADGTLVGTVTETTIQTTLSSTGAATNSFVVDTTGMEGYTLVCAEYLYDADGNLVAYHDDATDASQTVGIPTVSTVAASAATGDHEAPAASGQTIVDTVELSGLATGHVYTVTGELHLVTYDDEGNATDGGAIATATTYVTATESAASCEVRFTDVDLTDYQGCDLVAFEYLTIDDVIYASHEDVTDEDQTVHVPAVGTQATNLATGDHESPADETQTLVDTVELDNLTVGQEYTVSGTLHVRAHDSDGCAYDAGELTDSGGSAVTATTTFVATSSTTTVELSFEYDATDLQGCDVVAFEELWRGGVLLASHACIADEDQTLHVPDVATSAVNAQTGDGESPEYDGQTLVDTVTLTNLTVGHTYTVCGSVHVVRTDEDGNEVDGGVLTDADGNEVTGSVTFEADATEMTVTLEFAYDAGQLGDTDIVAFEELWRDGILLASHADVTDDGQTLDVPTMRTTATSEATGGHDLPSFGTQVVNDEVTLQNLTVGKTYEVTGVLHVRAYDEDGQAYDGGALTDADGSAVTAATSFVATDATMTVTLSFEVDASLLAGCELVAFEFATSDGVGVMSHACITDEDQTVYVPKVGTTATDAADGDQVLAQATGQVVVDTVELDSLLVGETYTVQGTLHVIQADEDGGASDAGELTGSDGSAVTAEVTFVATARSMTVELEYELDASGLGGTTLVVFEELWRDGTLLASHADASDEGQTMTVPEDEVTPPDDEEEDDDEGVPTLGDALLGAAPVALALAGTGLVVLGTATRRAARRHRRGRRAPAHRR